MWHGLYLSGEIRRADVLCELSASCGVIWAADGGLDRALALGIEPDQWVGDLDSLSTQGEKWLAAHPDLVEKLPEKKDWTDSEYALRALQKKNFAASRGVKKSPLLPGDSGLILLAALGSRYDHVLANLDLAASFVRSDFPILLTDGKCLLWTLKAPVRMRLVWPQQEEQDSHQDFRNYFSLISVTDRCEGIELRGAVWELSRASLTRGVNLGISNEPSGGPVTLRAERGILRLILDRESKEESREWTLLRD